MNGFRTARDKHCANYVDHDAVKIEMPWKEEYNWVEYKDENLIYSTLYHVSWIPELIKNLKAEEQGEKDTEEVMVADTEDVLEERQNTGMPSRKMLRASHI